MPRYDVRCEGCGREWEVKRGVNEPNPSCPECGGAVEQLPSRGTGFTIGGYSARNGYAVKEER